MWKRLRPLQCKATHGAHAVIDTCLELLQQLVSALGCPFSKHAVLLKIRCSRALASTQFPSLLGARVLYQAWLKHYCVWQWTFWLCSGAVISPGVILRCCIFDCTAQMPPLYHQ